MTEQLNHDRNSRKSFLMSKECCINQLSSMLSTRFYPEQNTQFLSAYHTSRYTSSMLSGDKGVSEYTRHWSRQSIDCNRPLDHPRGRTSASNDKNSTVSRQRGAYFEDNPTGDTSYICGTIRQKRRETVSAKPGFEPGSLWERCCSILSCHSDTYSRSGLARRGVGRGCTHGESNPGLLGPWSS